MILHVSVLLADDSHVCQALFQLEKRWMLHKMSAEVNIG